MLLLYIANQMATTKHAKKRNSTRRRKIKKRGGTANSLHNFVLQILATENQTSFNNLVTNPTNNDLVSYLLYLCYIKMFIRNRRSGVMFSKKDVEYAELIQNPIDIITKLLSAPETNVTNRSVFTALEPRHIPAIKLFNEITYFMHNTQNLNDTLIELTILFRPNFFITFVCENLLNNTPDVMKMFLEKYVLLCANSQIANKYCIEAIITAYNDTDNNNVHFPFEYYFNLLAQYQQNVVFYYAVNILRFTHFEILFNTFNPDINMLLPNFNMQTMLDFAADTKRNDIMMFLIDRGATISEFAVERMIIYQTIQPNVLKNALLHGANLPENILSKLHVLHPSTVLNQKIEIINTWKPKMLLYGLSQVNNGQHTLASGLEEFDEFLS